MGHKAPVTVSITKNKKSFLAYYPTPTSTDTSLEERILVPLPLPLHQSFITTHHQPQQQQQQQFKCVDTAHLTLSQAPSSSSPTSPWL
jgi:hypothetical protein